MSELVPTSEAELDALHSAVIGVLHAARHSVARSVNVAMVEAYWQIGGLIDAHVSVGSRSDTYGSGLLGDLSTRLRSEFGPGFEPTNLKYMRQFFAAFEIGHAARDQSPASDNRLRISVELSWTHYRLLCKVHQPDARRYYLDEAVAGRWSTRELERQILTRHFERGLNISSTPVSELADFETASVVSVLRDPSELTVTTATTQ